MLTVSGLVNLRVIFFHPWLSKPSSKSLPTNPYLTGATTVRSYNADGTGIICALSENREVVNFNLPRIFTPCAAHEELPKLCDGCLLAWHSEYTCVRFSAQFVNSLRLLMLLAVETTRILPVATKRWKLAYFPGAQRGKGLGRDLCADSIKWAEITKEFGRTLIVVTHTATTAWKFDSTGNWKAQASNLVPHRVGNTLI